MVPFMEHLNICFASDMKGILFIDSFSEVKETTVTGVLRKQNYLLIHLKRR